MRRGALAWYLVRRGFLRAWSGVRLFSGLCIGREACMKFGRPSLFSFTEPGRTDAGDFGTGRKKVDSSSEVSCRQAGRALWYAQCGRDKQRQGVIPRCCPAALTMPTTQGGTAEGEYKTQVSALDDDDDVASSYRQKKKIAGQQEAPPPTYARLVVWAAVALLATLPHSASTDPHIPYRAVHL